MILGACEGEVQMRWLRDLRGKDETETILYAPGYGYGYGYASGYGYGYEYGYDTI
jgi:hypothetical protein